MSKNDIIRRIEELNELENLIKEAEQEAEAIRDSIKQLMLAEEIEEMEAGQYIVRYTTITNNRFDSATFKKQMPDLYKAFLKQSTSRRFTVSA